MGKRRHQNPVISAVSNTACTRTGSEVFVNIHYRLKASGVSGMKVVIECAIHGFFGKKTADVQKGTVGKLLVSSYMHGLR